MELDYSSTYVVINIFSAYSPLLDIDFIQSIAVIVQ